MMKNKFILGGMLALVVAASSACTSESTSFHRDSNGTCMRVIEHATVGCAHTKSEIPALDDNCTPRRGITE